MSVSANASFLFDRNPLHVAHLQGPVDRLPDANLRAVYERAGKILLIQRWKELKSGEPHAFLLFETEQAAQACCSRIGALRVTSDRQNSRPITASPLACTNVASSIILGQWLRSQQMTPSYVIKTPPPAPPSAGFPLSCLTPLTENCTLVVQMLREHKCAPSWWRFVVQMYVTNKMWTPAQFILGQSTKSESAAEGGQTAKGKERQKEKENAGTEDVIDISDDSIGENMSGSDDDLSNDFARMQKLQHQQKTPTPAQLKPGPRKFGNLWLPHKRPNVQNARAKLGIVTAKDVKASATSEKPTPAEKPLATIATPLDEQDIKPEGNPEPTGMTGVEAASGAAPEAAPHTETTSNDPPPIPTSVPEPERLDDSPAYQPAQTTQSMPPPAPVTSTPSALASAASVISPPFVPTPMIGTPLPSLPTPPKPTLARSLPSTPKTISTLPRPATLPPTPSAVHTPISNPPLSPNSARRGPTLASLVRPQTQGQDGPTAPELVRIPTTAETVQVQQLLQMGDSGETRPKVPLPVLPAGMPQRPSWIPAGTTSNQDTTIASLHPSPSPSKSVGQLRVTPAPEPPPNIQTPVRSKADDRCEGDGFSKEEAAEPRLGVGSPGSPSKSQTSPVSMQISPETTRTHSSPCAMQASPSMTQTSPPTTQESSPSLGTAKRKSEIDTRGFEARLKRRRHRESVTRPSDSEQSAAVAGDVLNEPTSTGGQSVSAHSFTPLSTGPSFSSLSVGSSFTPLSSLGDTTFGASITPPRVSEEPLTPKESIRARLLGQKRLDSPRSSIDNSIDITPRLDRRTPLSDMDPRAWKATLDENEALKMKIRVLELTLPTAETVKNELYAERKEKTQLIESLEIQRSLLVQSEAMRKQSDTTREELGTRIKQLEDRITDSALALEQARESAHLSAEQRRRAEEASRIADSERTKVGLLLDVERTRVSAERAALAKEREARAEAETKCATTEARLASEQRRYTEASEMAEKERAEAKGFLDAEKAIVVAQEAVLAQEREIRAEIETKLGETEEQLKEEQAKMKEEQVKHADGIKVVYDTLNKELQRAVALIKAEQAQVKTERATIVEEREKTAKAEKELETVKEQLAAAKKELEVAAAEKQKHSAVEAELATVKGQLAGTERQLTTTKEKFETSDKHLTVTEELLASTKNQLFTTRSELVTTKEQVIAITARLTTVEGQLLTAKNELGVSQNQLSAVKAELASATEKLSTTHQQERNVEQREHAVQSQTASWNQQLNAAREQAAAAERRVRAAEEKIVEVDMLQKRHMQETLRIQQMLDTEKVVLAMERTTLARERLLRKEIEKKYVVSEERLAAAERQTSNSRRQLQDSANTHDGSREQLQTQRTLLHIARMRIQELEQAIQRVESELDASRSSEATAKTMFQLGWGGNIRSRLRNTHSSPISDADTDFAGHAEDAMDEDLHVNPFIPLMRPPRQQSFKLKRTALPARLLKVDMPSGDCVNIDLGGLPPNPVPIINLLANSKCAGVFWDIVMDEYSAMGGFEAAEAVASSKLQYIECD